MRVNAMDGTDFSDVPRYRKKAKKNPPKKADHEHEYESVILKYTNKYREFNQERGFVAGTDYAAGRRCIHCGKLTYGFVGAGCVPVAGKLEFTDVFGHKHSRREILPKYRDIPVVAVKDYWNLKEEST